MQFIYSLAKGHQYVGVMWDQKEDNLVLEAAFTFNALMDNMLLFKTRHMNINLSHFLCNQNQYAAQ